MKELTQISEAYSGVAGQTMALATIVNTVGSSYRRPGAHMLILPDGGQIGYISGGCLERDVIDHARKVSASGESILLTYDTTSEEDVIFGVGLGCKGAIQILVEPLNGPGQEKKSADRFVEFLGDLFRARRSGVAAVLFHGEGALKDRAGSRFKLFPDGMIASEIQSTWLMEQIHADASKTLKNGRSITTRYEFQDEVADVFVEVIHSPAALVVFGAGYDAIPLVRQAKELGFHVTVVDRRPAYAVRDRFPDADEIHLLAPEEVDKLKVNPRSAAVVMSHHYLTDQAWLKALLPLDLRYLGLMGPRRRAEKMLAELRETGMRFEDSDFQKLHNPVGLDIGADTPEQIALAVLSEIQAVFSGYAGGLLREKKGPIHSRPPLVA